MWWISNTGLRIKSDVGFCNGFHSQRSAKLLERGRSEVEDGS